MEKFNHIEYLADIIDETIPLYDYRKEHKRLIKEIIEYYGEHLYLNIRLENHYGNRRLVIPIFSGDPNTLWDDIVIEY